MSNAEDKSLKAALDALKKARHSSGGERAEKADPERNERNESKPGKPPLLAGIGAGRTLSRILAVLDTLWNDWARPATQFLTPVTSRIWRFYGWSYNKFAYARGEDGARAFSRNRAAVVTLALAAITIATPFILVRNIIPATARTIYDAGMLATMKEDRLFLGRAELINPDRQLYQVMGCRDISGCDGGDNTTYYRLRDNIILDIKYWTTRFEPYDPAEIAGAMVSELNDCTIRYYGRRSKALGWYPYIISASCVPV